MMEFAYYPGCSLETTGKPYDQSVREVFKVLDIKLRDIDDWNCCGATMYMSINELVGFSVAARNLAIAQKSGLEICAPCNSCYTILRKTNRQIAWDPSMREKVNDALGAANLKYDGGVEVRHPLDILVNDVKLDKVIAASKFKFEGLKVAPYYGCQLVRPVYHFDDIEDPVTMDRLLESIGIDAVEYQDKVRCCGGMLMTTFEDVALQLNNDLITHAEEAGAEVIATACPLCQMNLECYQEKINSKYGTQHKMPIVYFSQLVGLALGISEHALGLDSMMLPIINSKLAPIQERKAV